eukprot:403377338
MKLHYKTALPLLIMVSTITFHILCDEQLQNDTKAEQPQGPPQPQTDEEKFLWLSYNRDQFESKGGKLIIPKDWIAPVFDPTKIDELKEQYGSLSDQDGGNRRRLDDKLQTLSIDIKNLPNSPQNVPRPNFPALLLNQLPFREIDTQTNLNDPFEVECTSGQKIGLFIKHEIKREQIGSVVWNILDLENVDVDIIGLSQAILNQNSQTEPSSNEVDKSHVHIQSISQNEFRGVKILQQANIQIKCDDYIEIKEEIVSQDIKQADNNSTNSDSQNNISSNSDQKQESNSQNSDSQIKNVSKSQQPENPNIGKFTLELKKREDSQNMLSQILNNLAQKDKNPDNTVVEELISIRKTVIIKIIPKEN